VTAWRAQNDVVSNTNTTGLVFEWNQRDGTLTSGGNSKSIKIWDVNSQTCVLSLPSFKMNSVTDIKVKDNLILVGYLDGKVRLFDRRSKSVVRTYTEQNSKILKLSFSSSDKHFICASEKNVKFYDFRNGASRQTLEMEEGYISAFDVHQTQHALAM
jgi:WD40 repeat protein